MVWKHARPPHGLQVRRLVVLMCLAVGIPRLLNPNGMTFILPRLGIGLAFVLLALGLTLTAGQWRRRWAGRMVASIGFAMTVTLAWDTWKMSPTSTLISIGLAYAMLGEAATHHDC